MAVKQRELAEAIISLIEGSKSQKKASEAVAGYLVAERKTKELHSVLRKLEELQLERKGQLEVTATVVSPLSESTKRQIRQLFDAKEIIVHEEIDKEIIGGVRVRALDKVADFSVQARLRQLRQGRTPA